MRLTCILLLFLSYNWIQAQQAGTFGIDGANNEIPLVFTQNDFNGRLSVLVFGEEEYNYFVVDLTRFTDRLERIYFLNLAYAERKVVSITHDIEAEQLWFKAHYQYQESEITCLFADMKEEARSSCAAMTQEEKASWLAKFDKYIKK
jgi:hypothetical protein